MGTPNKLGGITPRRLVYPIGYTFIKNKYNSYQNWVCENCLSKSILALGDLGSLVYIGGALQGKKYVSTFVGPQES